MEATTSPFGSEITPDDVKEAFGFFDDWEDRYAYILDLGERLPPYPEASKTDEYLVKGCQSQVWLYPQVENMQLTFLATSDAHIVRGLLGIVLAAANNKSAADILDFDFAAYLEELGLARHLSPTRSNGLASMVKKIQSFAQNTSNQASKDERSTETI